MRGRRARTLPRDAHGLVRTDVEVAVAEVDVERGVRAGVEPDPHGLVAGVGQHDLDLAAPQRLGVGGLDRQDQVADAVDAQGPVGERGGRLARPEVVRASTVDDERVVTGRGTDGRRQGQLEGRGRVRRARPAR